MLGGGLGVRVREEDGFEREESDYYLHKMEEVRPLEAASVGAEEVA